MKKKIIAILGIIIVISVCGGIYLHISRANEKIETIEQETESTQEETLPTEETETVESVEQASTPTEQKSTESVPATTPTTPTTETTENTVSESKQTVNDGIDHGPEGDKPGYIYIPGYGYILDEGGGLIMGSPEGPETGEKIGVMN